MVTDKVFETWCGIFLLDRDDDGFRSVVSYKCTKSVKDGFCSGSFALNAMISSEDATLDAEAQIKKAHTSVQLRAERITLAGRDEAKEGSRFMSARKPETVARRGFNSKSLGPPLLVVLT